MTSKPGFSRTDNSSAYFKHVPQSKLEKKWGAKKKVTDIQDQHFSSNETDLHANTNEIEAYAKKVEKQYHKDRREQWMKGYIKNYISRHPKGMDLYKI